MDMLALPLGQLSDETVETATAKHVPAWKPAMAATAYHARPKGLRCLTMPECRVNAADSVQTDGDQLNTH